MTGEMIGLALLVLGVVLLVAKAVRVRWKLAQNLFLPASIIGGFLLLFAGPEVLGAAVGAIAGDDAPLAGGLVPEGVLDVWSELPELLISVVFATLFLGTRIPKPRQAMELVGPQLSFGFTLGAGQYVVGMLLAVAVLVPVFGMSPLAGTLIEIAFEGGHGTAAGLGGTFEDLGFPEGADLAVGLATVGIVSGVIIGIALINWAVRTGRAAVREEASKLSIDERQGLIPEGERESGATLTVRSSSIEPLAVHFGLVGLAILLGQALLSGLQAVEQALWADTFEVFEYVPLFPLAMLGGVAVQLGIDRWDRNHIVDRGLMARVQGFSLDLLIISALATLSLQVIGEHLGPFLLMSAVGIAWNVSMFFLLARRIIPSYWFERAIADFGQSMGVTATGLVLLRVSDPEGESPAFEAFGYKQLLFEPFFGGGLVTATSMPLVAAFGPWPLFVVMLIVMLLAAGLGLWKYGGMRPEDDPALHQR